MVARPQSGDARKRLRLLVRLSEKKKRKIICVGHVAKIGQEAEADHPRRQLRAVPA
jgi:hypothetical protein